MTNQEYLATVSPEVFVITIRDVYNYYDDDFIDWLKRDHEEHEELNTSIYYWRGRNEIIY